MNLLRIAGWIFWILACSVSLLIIAGLAFVAFGGLDY